MSETIDKKKRAPRKRKTSLETKVKKPQKPKGKKLTQTLPPMKRLSLNYYIILFFCAILMGCAIFFLSHPWEKLIFHNPFVKKSFQQIKAVLLKPEINASIDYNAYKSLSHNISMENQAAIEDFLDDNPNSSLSMSLRNQWLVFLAKESNWLVFLDNYQPTSNQSVECYHLKALYHSGKEALALSGVKRLWLAGYNPTGVCHSLFATWQNSSEFKEEYLWDRLQMAIDQKDTPSIEQLQQMLPVQHQALASNWLTLHDNPSLLTKSQLPNDYIGDKIRLDALKQWAIKDVTEAIKYWVQKKYHFSEAMTQDFYLTVSIHLALKADPQAESWFAKILPQYSTAQSRAWQVRFALMHQAWKNVFARIESMSEIEQQENIWQYWKARALVKMGRLVEANVIYNKLSQERQYYGFLAAYQQGKPLSVQQKNYPINDKLLLPYKQQIMQIQQLYLNTQMPQALQLTQDLLRQLDPVGKYTLARLFAQWAWFSESMNIVNRSPFQSDLRLRFPTPHLPIIQRYCAPVHISPALVYAIGRQESNFHEDVFSSAGGLGILQLTLNTAREFDPKITKEALYDPRTNIRISIQYLTKLDKQFDEHPALIASSYNAGPGKTRSWQPKNAPIPSDIWIETRPWEETRNYLKNIMAYYAVYEYLLGETPNINAFMREIPVN